MNRPTATRGRLGVLAAMGVILVLAGVLTMRLLSASSAALAEAPSAVVPAPKAIDVTKLTIHCWSCPTAQDGPLTFHTDLDMLAPLGTGTGNAATWFAPFAKPSGPRAAEGSAAADRSTDRPPLGKVLPPNDPILLEAEKWCDQATMKFYTEFFPINGSETQIPNLLLSLILARSWVARGMDAKSFDSAMADFTRAIRLGRLLRQQDTFMILDLVGLACIRMGAEAIYERARNEGKLELALTASIVAGEASALRLLSGARLTSMELGPYLHKQGNDSYRLELPDSVFQNILTMSTGSPDRRFRGEAIWSLHLIEGLGSSDQAAKARASMAALAESKDSFLAAYARSQQNTAVRPDEIDEILSK